MASRKALACLACALMLVGPLPGRAADTGGGERLVFLRHGEKPAASLGQLSCQGLNRALALPGVLIGRYGRPDYIFAPDPRQPGMTRGLTYDYVRPLATIEPTAIQLGMPVNTQYDTQTSARLEEELLGSRYAHALVFVAWEHRLIESMVRHIVAREGGNAAVVPEWKGDDYDSLYVVDITRDTHGKPQVAFHVDHEGLDGQSELCPAQQPARTPAN